VCKDLDARLVKHMVELLHDTGGIIEHINPTKLARIIESNRSPEPKSVEAQPVEEKVSTNGQSAKKPEARKKK
jgi:hypothetical protein